MEEIIELINRLGDLILEKKGQYKEEIKKLGKPYEALRDAA